MDQKAALGALEANIVEACTDHELVHSKDKHYRACVSIATDYFVKFGDPDVLWPELQTQSYIFDYARHHPHPNVPRIPQVMHHFGDSRTKYLVMEFITPTAAPLDLNSTGSRMALERPASSKPFASATNSLRSTRHLCFSQASRHMRKAYTLLSTQAQEQLSPVEICGDLLMFTPSDMHPSNLAVDWHGKTVLMDFAEIGMLPETFVAHTMSLEKRLAPIAVALSLSGSPNASMTAVSWLWWIVASPKLGASTYT